MDAALGECSTDESSRSVYNSKIRGSFPGLMEHAAQACVQVLEDERLIFRMSVLSVVRVIMEGTVSQLPAFYKITDTP